MAPGSVILDISRCIVGRLVSVIRAKGPSINNSVNLMFASDEMDIF
jgi:hypothetical protein